MYLGYIGDKIKSYSEQPLDADIYGFTKVEYTADKYILSDDETEYILYDDVKELNKAKQLKYEENDTKASEARYNQEFELEIQEKLCIFDTSEQTQRDLLTAFAVCSTGETYDGWVTNNGVVLNLTIEDVALISQVFKEKSNVYGKWNEYKQAIDEAETIEEVQAIIIDYNIEEEVL